MSAGRVLALFVTHWRVAWVLDVQAALVGAAYLWATRRARGSTRWPARRTMSFLAGIGCLVVALQSGIGVYDDRLLSVHMVQHMLLLLLAPLLLLGGRPSVLALRAVHGRDRRAVAGALRRLSRVSGPLPCLAVFSLVVIVTHLPDVYGAALRHPALHAAEHAAYLLAGVALWWPLLGGDPVPAHRLGGLGRLLYLLAAMPPMAVIGIVLNRAPALAYPAYAAPARGLGVSALVDQAQAGAIMWVAGGVVLGAVGVWMVMAALVAEEQRQRVREAHTVQAWAPASAPISLPPHGSTSPQGGP